MGVANYDSVENEGSILSTALSSFGRIDILINNAGILRDVSFKNMKQGQWDSIYKIHLESVFKLTQLCWL